MTGTASGVVSAAESRSSCYGAGEGCSCPRIPSLSDAYSSNNRFVRSVILQIEMPKSEDQSQGRLFFFGLLL